MDCRMNRKVIIGVLFVSMAIVIGSNVVWGADIPGDFFRGKTIHWIVADGASGGSGLDLNARTIAPFLEKETGARVRIENRKTDEGVNYIYNQGTRDGLTMGTKSSDSLIGNDILKAPGLQYEADKFNFIADVYPSVKVFQISPKLPYKTLEALRKAKGLKAGGTSAKGTFALGSAVMFEILHLDGKFITGFENKKSLVLALARGEVDFMVPSDSSAMRDEKDGYVINLFALGDKRSSAVPHVPSLSELGVKIPKELEAVFNFATSGGQPLVLPPGVPPERIEYLRKVFQRLSNNKELRKSMAKLMGTSEDFVSGQELQQQVAGIKADKEMAAKLDVLFKKYSVVR